MTTIAQNPEKFLAEGFKSKLVIDPDSKSKALADTELKEQEMDEKNWPTHLGIIPDGNRRWATGKGLSVIKAHNAACEILTPVLMDLLRKTKIPYFTIWGISTENLSRPPNEVKALFQVFKKFVVEFTPDCHRYGCCLRRIGNRTGLPEDLLQIMDNVENETKHYSRYCNLAINYGGKWDITNAVNQWMEENPGKKLTQEDIDKYIELKKDNFPEPDMIIRTGSDSLCKRTSGFLPWQSVYTEYYFVDKMLPEEMTFDDILEAFKSFSKTSRRFGK